MLTPLRRRSRYLLLIVAALAVMGVAPASADCVRAEATVVVAGQSRPVGSDCVIDSAIDQYQSESGSYRVGADGISFVRVSYSASILFPEIVRPLLPPG